MDKLRIGIIGVGRGEDMARYWHDPEGQSVVTGAADISQKNLEHFRKEINPDTFITVDYRRLLDRKDIDAIAVTSPDHCHEEHAIAALEAGKDVFCEKPLAISVEGCDRILRAWKRSGRKLLMGFNMHYINMFQVMKEMVGTGLIGDVRAVWVRHFVGLGGDWFFHDWHGLSRNTNSLLLQKGSHDIDVIHWITGHYTKKVAAFGSRDFYGGQMPNDLTCPKCNKRETCTEAQFGRRTQCAFRQEIDVEDNMVVILELEGGIKATYQECHFTPDTHRNYVFVGTEGRLENSEPDSKIWLKSRRSNTWKEHIDGVYDVRNGRPIRGQFLSDYLICTDFVRMVIDGKEPLTNSMQGRMSVAVGCAATESLRSGGKLVDVSPPPVL